MAMICRAPACGTRLSNKVQRNQHESMFHKTLFEDAAEQMIKTIINNATAVDLQKKVVYDNGRHLSYAEISKLDKDSEQYKSIRTMYANFIEKWLDTNPDSTVKDFFRITIFKIR